MVRKIMTMMVVADERICDGLYYARSMRLLRRILENPVVLEERLEVVERDID
jgi:pyruvate/2-oxoglutarate dehydrogenase complex dihydrolipoamide acyltransferase (E2) component